MSVGRIFAAVIDRRYRNFVIQRFRLKTSAVALWASGVSTIAAEQHPHVHFVNLRLEPAEKSSHAVPTIVFVIVSGVFATALLAVDDKVLIGFGQFLERNVDVDLFAGAGAQQIFLRFAEFVPAKNANDALFDRQRAVRNRLVQIDRDRPAKSPAFRAGAEWIIETEKAGCRQIG